MGGPAGIEPQLDDDRDDRWDDDDLDNNDTDLDLLFDDEAPFP